LLGLAVSLGLVALNLSSDLLLLGVIGVLPSLVSGLLGLLDIGVFLGVVLLSLLLIGFGSLLLFLGLLSLLLFFLQILFSLLLLLFGLLPGVL